ncbi:Retrovirus-related Pol polyprotein from transposon RE1 [Abeliophyllum distichum]|uniref:Retrovirus-related Pol polyprotein from transposon RE1 n=1 Tax=Abeliophyllum distichum TaxID=126358 RepID=A0ABD1UQ75_9LAMI
MGYVQLVPQHCLKQMVLHCLKQMQYQTMDANADVDVDADMDTNMDMGRGRGRGRNNGRYQPQGNSFKKHKMNENNSSKKEHEENCFRCGMKGHWSRTCRTTKHLVDLYQRSIKGKEKVETNFADFDGPIDVTHLDVSDFFADQSRNINHLIEGGVIENLD